MKAGDLVIGRRDSYGSSVRLFMGVAADKTPGVLVDIIDSNVFGGDAIVTVLWAGQSRAMKTMISSLKKVNP